MMMTFDRVLPELIRICGDHSSGAAVQQYCVVRDVRGRVRIVLEPGNSSPSDAASLTDALQQALGRYFVPPILSVKSHGNERHLAELLLKQAAGQWPSGWPRSYQNVLGGGDTPIAAGTRWTGIERTIGKEAWLASESPRPPWPLLNQKTPPIVTFHSFKGGVGRTTLVATYAIHLANQSPTRRIAIVDLDLEAPGVASLFGVRTERGVLDILVDHIATGSIDLADAAGTAALDGELGPRITVYSAGAMNDSYIQKLARLDFSSTEPGKENPVGLALTAMLKQLRSKHDVILLDARAGLHDLAGMSLHGLAHVDVLVFRGTVQNLEGLDQTLRTIGGRSGDPELVLVETLLPTDEGEFETRRHQTRSRVYTMLCESIYSDEDLPQLTDSGVPHDVLSVRRTSWLDGIDTLRERVQTVLNEPDLQLVATRIDEMCTPSEDGNDE